jgi:hypothetical protein
VAAEQAYKGILGQSQDPEWAFQVQRRLPHVYIATDTPADARAGLGDFETAGIATEGIDD